MSDLYLVTGGHRHGDRIRTDSRYVEFPEPVPLDHRAFEYDPNSPYSMPTFTFKRHRYEAKLLETARGEVVRVMAYMGVV